ncbi:hypothetical protein Poly51_46190 [Rubripirellula tenax]|uniref:Glycosyltransferase subfamily 4-like N-terminal domain-containing protein n=2 Tax=Rubripirellula tenax TaxID=2528015 RepID=A0A5C6EKT4_9BACT|nr:hypothetical protein Poly51_46190 [Rubripirellula tenax]
MVGRHFWPHGSVDSAAYLIQLAQGLNRRGVQIQVCTPRYAASWPEKFWLREIPVHRPAAAPRSDWSIGRYTRHLTQWLRTNASSFDLMLVDGIREESMAAIEAARSTGCPTLLRYGSRGSLSDQHYWSTSRTARRCGTVGRMADGVIVNSATCSRSLLAEGYSPERIIRIDPGFAAGPLRSSVAQKRARRSLAAINTDLHVDPDARVAICMAPMTRDGGIQDLVRAAYRIVDQVPKLKLWFIGDGPHRDWIYEQLRGDGVRASIAMPGSFCDGDELFAAADVFVQPDESGLDYFLPTAVSAELPIVSIQRDAVRSVLVGPASRESTSTLISTGPVPGGDPAQWVQWIDQPTATAFTESIAAVAANLPMYQDKASMLRRHWIRSRPMVSVIDEYVEAIERTIAKKNRVRGGDPTEVKS